MADVTNYLNLNDNEEEIYVQGFGKQLVRLYRLEGTSQLFIAEFTYKNEEYEAVINSKGQTLLPFSTAKIQNYFNTKDHKDYCFVLYDDINYYKSYHIKKVNKEFTIVGKAISTSDTLCRFLESEKGYWVVERVCNEITDYCLYDVDSAKVITPYFSEIKFEEEDDPRVLALFEKDIYYNPKEYGDSILLDRMVGFIDYEGNFISPIYSEEQNEFYDSLGYNHDHYFGGYNTMIESITYKLTRRYEEKNAIIENSIDILFDNLYSVELVKKANQPAKILQFDRRKK